VDAGAAVNRPDNLGGGKAASGKFLAFCVLTITWNHLFVDVHKPAEKGYNLKSTNNLTI
jgi:hypothetical protein